MVQSARNRQSINHAVYDKQSVQFHNSKGNDAAPQSLPRSQSGIATSKQTTTGIFTLLKSILIIIRLLILMLCILLFNF